MLHRSHLTAILAIVALASCHDVERAGAQLPELELCGTRLTPEEAEAQRERWIDSGLIHQAPPARKSACTIAIAAHIVRDGQGQGGLPMSQYDQGMIDLIAAYVPMGISFTTVSIDYIDDDAFYTGPFSINALRSINVVPNAINVWFTPNPELGACGISSYTTSPVQGIVMYNGCTGVPSNPSTFPHEVGHYLDLYHTHETAFGSELVNGSNCGVAGDLLCDTPADPVLGSSNMDGFCNYTGIQFDTNGDPYAPDPRLFMSYATPKTCRDLFTPQSLSRMWLTLLNFRPELNAGCAFPAFSVSSVTPAAADRVSTVEITLEGENLQLCEEVSFGADVVVHSFDYQAPSSLLVRVSVPGGAVAGPRDVTISSALDTLSVPGGFVVNAAEAPSPHHYVSPQGASVFPYWSPETATSSIADAIAAASPGDIVRIDDTGRTGVALTISKAVTLEGGWDSSFTTRDLEYGKSPLALAGNLQILNATGTVVIDGLDLSGGTGSLQLGPVFGNAGGALKVIGSDAVIVNTHIHDNNAPYGGGLFAHTSTVTLLDTTVDLNGIATAGGALYAFDSTLDLQRVSIVDNAASSDGAGLYLNASTVTLDDVLLRGNQSIVAARGGAVFAQGGQFTLGHALVIENTASQGGGLYLTGLASGSITASTFDLNAGAVVLENSPIGFFNNLVTNTGGDAIRCVGTAASPAYNLVWNSSGSDYVGCVAGMGSISADPLYVNAATGDYHLGLSSPGIDAGDPDPQYDDPDGSRADLGRYGSGTFTFDQPAAPQGLSGEVAEGRIVLQWSANAEPDLDVYAIYGDPNSGFVPSSSNLITTTTATSADLGPYSTKSYFRVSAVDQDGYASGYSDEAEVYPSALQPVEVTAFFARGGYPNPFNPLTTLAFGLPAAAHVEIEIFDLRGREIETLVSRRFEAGVHEVRWNAKGLASGTYFARVRAGGHEELVKLVLLK